MGSPRAGRPSRGAGAFGHGAAPGTACDVAGMPLGLRSAAGARPPQHCQRAGEVTDALGTGPVAPVARRPSHTDRDHGRARVPTARNHARGAVVRAAHERGPKPRWGGGSGASPRGASGRAGMADRPAGCARTKSRHGGRERRRGAAERLRGGAPASRRGAGHPRIGRRIASEGIAAAAVRRRPARHPTRSRSAATPAPAACTPFPSRPKAWPRDAVESRHGSPDGTGVRHRRERPAAGGGRGHDIGADRGGGRDLADIPPGLERRGARVREGGPAPPCTPIAGGGTLPPDTPGSRVLERIARLGAAATGLARVAFVVANLPGRRRPAPSRPIGQLTIPPAKASVRLGVPPAGPSRSNPGGGTRRWMTS